MGCVAAHDQGQFWFGRRPSKGLWAGLWEFPSQVFNDTPTTDDIRSQFGVEPKRLGIIRHLLTHRIVHLAVFATDVSSAFGPFHYENFQLLEPRQLQSLGTSSLTEKALAMAQDWVDIRA